MDKVFGKQTTFTAMVTNVLVAISDQGVIQRPKTPALPELLKADQVTPKVDELMRGHQQANRLFSLTFSRIGRTFSDKGLTRLTAFLRAHHRSLETGVQASDSEPDDVAVTTSVPSQNAPQSEGPSVYRCRHCNNEQLSVLYGKYGYYFKCAACKGNTPIKESCKECGKKLRVRRGRTSMPNAGTVSARGCSSRTWRDRQGAIVKRRHETKNDPALSSGLRREKRGKRSETL